MITNSTTQRKCYSSFLVKCIRLIQIVFTQNVVDAESDR